MLGLMLLVCVFVYVCIALSIYKRVFNKKSKIIKMIYVVIVFMIPMWNFIVSGFVYVSRASFFDGSVVYRQVHSHSYFAGDFDDYVIEKNGRYYYPKSLQGLNGFESIEIKVKKVMSGDNVDAVDLYCRLEDNSDFYPNKYLSCLPIDSIKSRYAVYKSADCFMDIEFVVVNVVDNFTKEVIGESSYSVLKVGFPFFEWLGWNHFPATYIYSCPNEDRTFFVYKVLIPYGFDSMHQGGYNEK